MHDYGLLGLQTFAKLYQARSSEIHCAYSVHGSGMHNFPSFARANKYVVNCAKIYAICSTLSLIWVDEQTYFDLITSWYAFCLYVHARLYVTFNFSYEAYLLYSFFSLLVAFINEFKNEEEQEALERGEKQSKSKTQEFDSDSEEESRPLFTVVDGHKVYFGEERVVYVLKSKPPMAIGDGCHPMPTPCCKCKFGTGR